MRMYYVIGVLITLFLASCGEPPMPPSDEEMIRHFATHEAAFRKVYEIMSESSEGSFHYPPLSPDGIIILDSIEQSDTSYESNDEQDIPVYGLLKPDRILLDSLLSEIGCGFILVDRREWRPERDLPQDVQRHHALQAHQGRLVHRVRPFTIT